MISITTEYSWWFLPLILLLAFGGAYFLYRNDKRFEDVSKQKIFFLKSLRFLSILIIGFFLLSPYIKLTEQTIEQASILLVQDNSKSIALAGKENIDELLTINNKISSDLSQKFNVERFLFDDEIYKSDSISLSGKSTNLGNAIEKLQSLYENKNIGAMILLSDGVYNKGNNPVYEINNNSENIYTVLLGDTVSRKDALIGEVRHNKSVYFGNYFPVQVQVESHNLKGDTSVIKLMKNDSVIEEQEIVYNTDDFYKKYLFNVNADEKELLKYNLVLEKAENEDYTSNNYKPVVVEVIDSKIKIALISNAPHPDIGALKEAAEMDINFEFTQYRAKDVGNINIEETKLIIFHQLPGTGVLPTSFYSKVQKAKISRLYVIGNKTNLSRYNKMQPGISIFQNKNSIDEAKATYNDKFTLFTLNNDVKEFIKQTPPLVTPFGNYKVSAEGELLFTQSINTIQTDKPLIYLGNRNNIKEGIICGEGIWKWRMTDYRLSGNFENFDLMMNKIYRYLSITKEKSRFNVTAKKVYSEHQSVIFDAELYNELYEPINYPTIDLQIKNNNGDIYDFVFNKTTDAYRINTGSFNEGDYTYKASVTVNDKIFTQEGIFSVVPLNIEAENLEADVNTLYKLSHKSGGKLYKKEEINVMINDILSNPDILSVSYSNTTLSDLINKYFILFIIISLLAIEWFLRKYWGSY